MISKTIRSIVILGFLLATPASLQAGANTWTGSVLTSPVGTQTLLAADPHDPYVVYGAFGAVLYRSGDGGRTWSPIRSFDHINSLLVHPAAPSTLYVGADEITDSFIYFGVYKSADAGATWTRVPLPSNPLNQVVTALSGSPTDPSIVLAGTASGRIYTTTNGGGSWTFTTVSAASGIIASLVIDPRDNAIAYAGTEVQVSSYYYYSYTFGDFARTSNAGSGWSLNGENEFPGGVQSIAVDPTTSSTLYMATGLGVLKSEDSGVSWSGPGAGLDGGGASSIVLDPADSQTLYAGTAQGVFRSRDAGRSWAPFGQPLVGVSIDSLAIGGESRTLHAGTPGGAFDLELSSGPLDVAPGADGGSRVLVRGADRGSLSTLDASGHWTESPLGDPSPSWIAVAVSSGADGLSRVLWQSGDGRSGIEILGPAGRPAVFPIATSPGWSVSDVSASADGRTNLLWTSVVGKTFIASVYSSGVVSYGHEYGPARGWSAVAIADGPAGDTWVLWRSVDGRSGVSLHENNFLVTSFQWPGSPGWTAEDITVGADGRPRLLRTKTDGTAEVSTVDAAGQLTAGRSHQEPGLTPRRISAGADGRTRLLFSAADGGGALFLLDADNTIGSRESVPTPTGSLIE